MQIEPDTKVMHPHFRGQTRLKTGEAHEDVRAPSERYSTACH